MADAPTNRGPWALTVEQAAARQADADRYIAGIIARQIHAGMSDNAILMTLARHGIGANDWRRIRPLVPEAANG